MRLKKLLVSTLPISGLLFCSSLYASEGGGSNYLPGFYGDFAMAVMPKAGTYFYNFFAAYRDRTGDTATILEMPGVEQVSDTRFFGGRYFAGIFPGLVATWDNNGAINHSRFGIGDAYLLPVGLSWEFGAVTVSAFEGLIAPTGYYQKGDVNPGRNIWTFDHNLMFTASLPGRNEFSFTLGYMNNLENRATHYTSGDEVHVDYLFGHYLDDNLALGVVGSHYKQVTKDRVRNDTIIMPLSQASTIGLAVMFAPKLAGRDVTLSLKWLQEFNVTGRMPQDYLVFRALFAF